MATRINILTFYEHREEARREQESQWAAAKDDLANKMLELKSVVDALERLRNDKLDRLQQAKSDGLDVTPLNIQIEKLDGEINAKTVQFKAMQGELDNLARPSTSVDYWDMKSIARILAHYGCTDAETVHNKTIDKCSDSLQVNTLLNYDRTGRGQGGVTVDEFGRAIECTVFFDSMSCLAVKIRPSDRHFHKDFVPKVLNWLPAQDVTAKHASSASVTDAKFDVANLPKISAYVNTDTEGLILSHRPSGPEFNGALDLMEHFATALKSGGNAIDLNETYPDNAFLATVRNQLLEVMTDNPRFPKNSRFLTSQQVHDLVLDDWKAISGASWSEDVVGPLAKLKYLVELGERARFWCMEYENYYGYRLRSRDHTWVRGHFFLDANLSVLAPGGSVTVHQSNPRSWHIATIGRMRLSVCEVHDSGDLR